MKIIREREVTKNFEDFLNCGITNILSDFAINRAVSTPTNGYLIFCFV